MVTTLHTDSAKTWASIASASFIDLEVRESSERFDASIRSLRVGEGLQLNHVQHTSSTIVRTEKSAASDQRRDVLLLTPRTGQVTVRRANSCATLRPGQFSLHSASEPYSLEFPSGGDVLVAQIPAPTGRVFVTAEPVAGTIGAVFRSLMIELLTDQSDAELLGDTALHLAQSLLLRNASAGAVVSNNPQAIVLRAQAFMRAQLADFELHPALVAAHLRVSLRYLQLTFAQQGLSCAASLTQIRLEHARSLLANPALQELSISEVAAMCGLETNTFIRAFRRVYQQTPGVFRTELLHARS